MHVSDALIYKLQIKDIIPVSVALSRLVAECGSLWIFVRVFAAVFH